MTNNLAKSVLNNIEKSKPLLNNVILLNNNKIMKTNNDTTVIIHYPHKKSQLIDYKVFKSVDFNQIDNLTFNQVDTAIKDKYPTEYLNNLDNNEDQYIELSFNISLKNFKNICSIMYDNMGKYTTLNNMLIDNSYMVTTDGSTLTRYEHTLKLPNNFSLCLNKELVKIISKVKLLKNEDYPLSIYVNAEKDKIKLSFKNITIYSYISNDTFPRYSQLIDEDNYDNKFELKTKELKQVLKQVKPFITCKFKTTILDDNEIYSNDNKDNKFNINMLNKKYNNKVKVGLSHDYLNHCVKLGDKLTCLYKGNSTALHVQSGNYLKLIMPIRL